MDRRIVAQLYDCLDQIKDGSSSPAIVRRIDENEGNTTEPSKTEEIKKPEPSFVILIAATSRFHF